MVTGSAPNTLEMSEFCLQFTPLVAYLPTIHVCVLQHLLFAEGTYILEGLRHLARHTTRPKLVMKTRT
jgi:hypothetical protein